MMLRAFLKAIGIAVVVNAVMALLRPDQYADQFLIGSVTAFAGGFILFVFLDCLRRAKLREAETTRQKS